MIFLGQLTTLLCQRLEPTQVACELTSSSLLGERMLSIPTGELQSAEVEVNEDSDGDTYRVVLVTKNSRIPLSDVYSSGERGKRTRANQINAFISNPEQMSLRIQQDHRWFAYSLGGIFAVVGGGIILSSLMWKIQTSCLFDKGSGRMYLKQQNIFTSEMREQMLPEILEARVIEGTDSDGDKNYATKLLLRAGEHIPLQISGSASAHYKIAQSINQFLGVKS